MEKSLKSVFILEVLKKYSDVDKPLKQSEIIAKLDTDYNIHVERKSVGRALTNLETAGFPIVQVNNKGYYYERDFDPSELKCLIDSVLFSRHISCNYAQELIEKIIKLGGANCATAIGNIVPPSAIKRMDAPYLFYNIETLCRAINEDKKVSFYYNNYDINKNLKHVSDEKTVLDPYAFCVINNNYYLVGKPDKKAETERFRVGMITDLEILDEPRYKNNGVINFNVGRFAATHPYYYAGKPVTVTLEISNNIVNEVIDAFSDFKCLSSGAEKSVINVEATPTDMELFLRRFGAEAEVINPPELRDKMRKFAVDVHKKYAKKPTDRYNEAVDKARGQGGALILTDIDVSGKHDHETLSDVTEAYLSTNNLTDASFIGNYQKLKSLYVENNAITDLSALVSCKDLEKLTLINTDVSDLSFLKDLTNLQYLRLENNANITDFTPIYDCFDLAEMTINISSVLSLDLDKLKFRCPHLRVQVPEITDINSYADRLFSYDEWIAYGFDKVRQLFDMFVDNIATAKKPEDRFTKEDALSVLDFIKGKQSFTKIDYNFNRLKPLGNVKEKAVFTWLIACGILSYDESTETYTVLSSEIA